MQYEGIEQSLFVCTSDHFRAVEGVSEGDGLSFADELVMDDIYRLTNDAKRAPLLLVTDPKSKRLTVANESTLGKPGNTVVLDSCATFVGPNGVSIDVLILVEVEDDEVEEIYLLPLSQLEAKADYRLVGVDRHVATTRLSDVGCVSFMRGTRITLASGAQKPIEELVAGDRILTRDAGHQNIRWIGQATLRAEGELAPVVIRKNTLKNTGDLTISPDHRLYVHQRSDRVVGGQKEILVKARDLLNGDTIVQVAGGYVDYFQLLFEQHQIIYAEGIAVESLLIDPRTRTEIPEASGDEGQLRRLRGNRRYEVKEHLLNATDVAQLFEQAKSR